jgi:hypothetical protein
VARTLSSEERKALRHTTKGNIADLMPAELLPAEPPKLAPKDVVKGPKTPKIKTDVVKRTKPADVVKEVKPQKKEKSKEELAHEKLLKRVEILRARALEMKVEFPPELEESLKKQTTKGAVCRTWKAYLQSKE